MRGQERSSRGPGEEKPPAAGPDPYDPLTRPRFEPPPLAGGLSGLRPRFSAVAILALALLVAGSALQEWMHHDETAAPLGGLSSVRVARVRVRASDLPHHGGAPLTWGQLFDLYGLPDADIAGSVEATRGEPQPVEPRSYRDVPISEGNIVISL